MANSIRLHPGKRPTIIEHDDEEEVRTCSPEEFLDAVHPENDAYMQAIEHIQRKIMHASTRLRTKQVNIIKSVFSGMTFTQAAEHNKCHPATVSKLVRTSDGQRLLSLLQYHLKLLEGPNEALRRNMLWRIAVASEQQDPKTAIKALEALNKMHFQTQQLKQPQLTHGQSATQVVNININQAVLPRGVLDR